MKNNGQPNNSTVKQEGKDEKQKEYEIEINIGPYIIFFEYALAIFVFLWLTIGLGPQGDYIFTKEIGVVISICSWGSLILTLISYECSPILKEDLKKSRGNRK